MEIKICDKDRGFHPYIENVLPGTMLIYERYNYIKLDAHKAGEGVFITRPTNTCLLMNPRYGSIRAIRNDQQVVILAPVNDTEVYEVKDASEAQQYLKR